ncbi:MAG: ral nucleoside transport system ATP-binding protein [Thermoleophilaceae bacterium]|nr:ral nucleoside transport system ATP-binding protein [Thermoleophilaceae bacterium]
MTTLVAEGISKRFGATQANQDISLSLTGGEVHALLGQNGAGKSTFVGVLTGRMRPDVGRVLVDGEEMALGDPGASVANGIATVFQHLMLVPAMTGLENIALALGKAADRSTRRMAEAVQEQFQLPAQLDVPVRDIELPQRQRVELVRALCLRPRVLLLDEPTSLLDPTAVPAFLGKVRELADAGLAVLLITHRLHEARGIADRVTVLRHGRQVATYEKGSMPSAGDLAVAVVGERVVDDIDTFAPGDAEPVLELEDVFALDDHKHPAVNDIGFELRPGEILGIAGVDGNGQIELLQTIAGMRPARVGRVVFDGEDVTGADYAALFQRGVQFVSGDRERHGIVPTFTVADHFEYALGRSSVGGLPETLGRYDVRPPDPSVRGDELSGGNQQKMLVAAVFERDCRLILLSYPTHGLDVQASLAVRRLIVDRARERGVAMIVSSSDLEELMSISHRIAVMSRGRIAGIQSREAFDRRQLAEWFTLDSPVAA